jgi:hypothetical protein
MRDTNQGIKRRSSRLPPKHELREIAAGVDLPPMLDLIHVTATGRGEEIIRAQQIETRRCSIFDHDLVYTFVGRPAYRMRNGQIKQDQISRFPFVFVISPEKLELPYHLYPFDTGAAVEGRYDEAADPYVPLEDYELAPELSAAQRHISWQFGNNASYFDGDPKPGLMGEMPHFKMVVRACLKIANLAATTSNRPDKRASAIEVAYDIHIRLKDHVRLVILPQQYLEDLGHLNIAFISELNALGLKWETYDWRPNEMPDTYVDDITRIVRRHLQNVGQL